MCFLVALAHVIVQLFSGCVVVDPEVLRYFKGNIGYDHFAKHDFRPIVRRVAQELVERVRVVINAPEEIRGRAHVADEDIAPWIRGFARLGFASRGVVYLLMGWIASAKSRQSVRPMASADTHAWCGNIAIASPTCCTLVSMSRPTEA